MNTSIVVVTLDAALSQLIGTRKTFFIPGDLRRRFPRVSMVSYLATAETTASDLASSFLAIESSGVIVLCDNRLANLVPELATPLFTVIFDHTLGGKIAHNYFGMILSKVLKLFAAFETRFDDEKTRKLLILPLRNFIAEDLREIHALFRNGVEATGELMDRLDQLLKSLRQRQKPKTNNTSSKRYVVDDEDRYFEYGHEVHAQLEKTVPPHHALCAVTGVFRYGKRYDERRHFNVSRADQQISGVFFDCHSASGERAARSHLNMFPNDFFGAN